MDYYEILNCVITINNSNNGQAKDLNERLQEVLQRVLPILTESDKKFISDDNENENEFSDIGYRYVRLIVCMLQNLKTFGNVNEESLFCVKRYHALKVAIELITAIGIIPALLPGIRMDIANLCPNIKAMHICGEKMTDIQKYKRNTFTVVSLMDLYNEIMFRPVIIAQTGPLLAALLQLGYAPLIEPNNTNESDKTFIMTQDLYERLKKDQEHFVCLLNQLLIHCPASTSMKQLMLVLGIKGAPKWLQRVTRKHLIQQIMQPNGVISFITTICEDTLDVGKHWNTLDTVSKLIATSHENNPNEYYKAICPQILDLLTFEQIHHSSTIANCCITVLYDYNPDSCFKNIIEKICNPLLMNSKKEENIVIPETEVEKCIVNLTKCFITVEAKFKRLPCEVLKKIIVPLFCVYNSIRLSVCLSKFKIKQLLLKLLHEESQKDKLFAEFLGHNLTNNFGYRLASRLGPTCGIEIIGIDETLNYEQFADSLLDLVATANVLSIALFSYLLQSLSNLTKLDDKKDTYNLLKTENDIIERLRKQLAAVKLLSSLANISAVREAQIENPEPILSFIKSSINEYIEKRQMSLEENDCETLYASLMLIKIILSERKKLLNLSAFNDFIVFLRECCVNCSLSNIPTQLLLLMKELIELIETRGQSQCKNYQDLSINRKTTNKFEEALKDLTDPLLPVRAHGLIVLTKLIENEDSYATARKAVILQIFKENLKHDDSFIYLAAINGLCALATSYPEVVIEILVYEYIDMPQRVSSGEITVETRIKLGEILVKVTRGLGEMATAYKNILINGFLCATRDSDSLVRASSLSCLGELCKVLGFRLGDIVTEVLYCISCIIKTDKAPECRRAAVMVSTLLLRGLGRDTLTSLGNDLVDLYRGLKHLRDNDEDPVLRLHVQLSLEELDQIVRNFLFSPPKFEKKIFLLDSS